MGARGGGGGGIIVGQHDGRVATRKVERIRTRHAPRVLFERGVVAHAPRANDRAAARALRDGLPARLLLLAERLRRAREVAQRGGEPRRAPQDLFIARGLHRDVSN
jgi:hypothetical protein